MQNIKHRIKRITGRIDISVIIPFHNVELYIEECLDSVFRQTGVSIEVILINDGSTDNTATIVDRYKKEHDNMLVYEIPQNGPGYARNYGVRHARGDYIAFLDADDKLVAGVYRRMIRAAKNHDAEVSMCNATRFNSQRRFFSDIHEAAYNEYDLCTHITQTPCLIYDTTSWNKLIKRDFYEKNGFRFPEHVVYEDISFNADVHMKCNRVVMMADTGYLWRSREDSSNPSLTQAFYTDKNRGDRLLAAKWIAEHVLTEEIPEKLRKTVLRKLLEIDLKIVLDSVEHVSEDKGREIFADVRAFIDKYISSDAFGLLSVIEQQRYEYVRNDDIAGYKRLMDFRRNSYHLAPVSESDGELYIELPDDLFTISNRNVTAEFTRTPRKTRTDNVRMDGDKIEVTSHIYLPRYNMSRPEDQKITVFLINEETGQKIPVQTQPAEASFLTEEFGTVSDEATGTVARYNYDYAGFTFYIGKEMLDRDNRYNTTKYTAIVEYKDRIFQGTQILKGADGTKKAEYKTACIKGNGADIGVTFGAQNELQIIVKKTE